MEKAAKMLKSDYVILTREEARTLLKKLKQADIILHLTFKGGKNDFWN